jgi:phosphoribosylamine--glycine ligase
MRFLGVGETCDLGALYLSLRSEGHEVRVAVSEPEARGTLRGLVEMTPDWRASLDWLKADAEPGVILFESVSEGLGALQDELRRDGFHVIGGSAYGDRLENDRAFAQGLLAELGFPKGHVKEFQGPRNALAYVAARPRRYVLKYSGPDHASSDNYVGRFSDGRDVAAILTARMHAGLQGHSTFILMDFIAGVEMGVGAYFDGERFLTPACLDWEHKRFFAGDLGELTGEMGTVVTYDRTQRFFDLTLRKMEAPLREHAHVGYVNLNTIVNDEGIFPLEFTCRFGYPGFAILAPLQETPWGTLFRAMVTRSGTFRTRPGFCVGVVLTTPPFPYTRKQVAEPVGLPVLIGPDLDGGHCHYGEVGLDDSGQLVTTGLYGWTLVITGRGDTSAAAQRHAYRNVGQVAVPNGRYRLDIGDRLAAGEYDRLNALGYLDPQCPA